MKIILSFISIILLEYSNQSVMDRIYYYYRMTNMYIHKYSSEIDNKDNLLVSNIYPYI